MINLLKSFKILGSIILKFPTKRHIHNLLPPQI